MNNTATNKIKHSQQLFALGPQIVHVCSFFSSRTHLRELPGYKNDNWFLFVTLHWIKHYQTKLFWGGKTIFCRNNYASLSLKHSCFLRVGGRRIRMFSCLYFNYWQNRDILLNSGNSYQKLYITINWYSDLGIFVAEYEGCTKMNENLLNRQLTYYMHHKSLEHALKS